MRKNERKMAANLGYAQPAKIMKKPSYDSNDNNAIDDGQ